MCDDRLRDGTVSSTIPDRPTECYNFDVSRQLLEALPFRSDRADCVLVCAQCDTDVRYGRHESFDWYKDCKYRSRNKGLFTANQNLDGNGAIYTRQNPNGARRGYECPEERDYYPYWGPTPWKDIAVLTNQPRRCESYRTESQNVQDKWHCVAPAGWVKDTIKKNGKATGFIPIEAEKCQLLKWYDAPTNTTQYGQWTKVAAWGIDAPVCRETAYVLFAWPALHHWLLTL